MAKDAAVTQMDRNDLRVCAVIVAFHPDSEFETRLLALASQVGGLIVVDNTPASERRRHIVVSARFDGHALVIESEDNLGVAAALNQGLNQALQWGYEWLLTMDQDSRCHFDMVNTLLSVEAACLTKPAVIGGNYQDTRNNRPKVEVGRAGEYLDQKTVITSGCLVKAHFAMAIGGFREDYFIDQLDHEFCLRVRANGGRVVISRRPVMLHSVGEAGGVRLPIVGELPSHSPLRKYYIARNSLVTIIDYWGKEPSWCVRRAVRLVLGLCLMSTLEQQRIVKVRAFFAGIVDALTRQMGPCRRKLFET